MTIGTALFSELMIAHLTLDLLVTLSMNVRSESSIAPADDQLLLNSHEIVDCSCPE